MKRGASSYGSMLASALAGGVAAAAAKRARGRGGFFRNKKKARVGAAPIRRRNRRRFVRSGKRSGPYTVVLTKRRRQYKENHSTENRQTSLTVVARDPTPMNLIRSIMEPQWFRAQGLTQYDTTCGFYPIANRLEPSGNVILPVHVWDLTCCQNYNGAITVTPDVGHFLWFSSTAANANAWCGPLKGQDADGNTIGSCSLLKENTTGNMTTTFPNRKAFHHWSHVKMNLYGCRKRATKFKVELILVKEEYADFIEAAETNTEKKKLFDYLSRPYMYTNLNAGDQQVKNDFKILKSYETVIAPSRTDEWGGSTPVPHIQTLNWFINHNRIRRYDWKSGDPGNHLQNAGYDTEFATNYQSRTDTRTRLYLLVRALSPERRTITDVNNNVDPDPISEPSYDCVIRQKFSVPT